ncbi:MULTISPECIES: hypothetical protein [Pseudoalteromonas]|uniref:Membrane protein triplicated sequence n=1 Tax=Pseudoalteromonas atlantica TaxID=288 RepID=A0ABQ0UE95_PSEAF|nr:MULTISPECIES: hypothetical protein [unclassified Pseudoalteromonas]GEK76765.1 hypothetical protein PAT01_20690 [Pseudoalteromonas atlantica]MDC9497978.1 hypothetical protein [Pseudoalteromonas sp. Angola-20]MDC9517872.1 hypothetical protein [Pseudoalteromonas sp. Angola-22]MDC9534273.1 hypothetical protein [Pseudoalteromonas sp. Angola-9]TMP85296.1 hypothetical protein CWB71_00280 [Pseudoalteromonas sp. S983]
MADILWGLVDLGYNVGVLFTWFFILAFLYNLSASINKSDKSRAQLSFLMMVSYTASLFMDPLIATPHLNYFYHDAVTILVLLLWRNFTKQTIPTPFYYLIVGLSFNACLFLGMHYDIEVRGTLYYWWFWNVYVFGMYFTDLLMPLVLVVNKDILGLVKLSNYLTTKLKRFRYA